MIELTRKQTLELLEAAVNSAGPDTVRSCFYASEMEDGTLYPQCIVADVFSRLDESGMLLETLHLSEGTGIQNFTDEHLGIKTEPGVYALLHQAQSIQDNGDTWGQALDDVERLAVAMDQSRSFRSNLFNN